MKLCRTADGYLVYVSPVYYPDIILNGEELDVYESSGNKSGEWIAGLSPRSIAVKVNDRASRLWFNDLSLKRSRKA